MYVVVPKEIAKYARNSFNLAVNEQLGHYTVRNSVSVNKLEDVYELEMEASLSPEDEMMEKEEKREITKLITDLIHQLCCLAPYQ